MPVPAIAPVHARALAIRDHVVPLIRKLAGAQRAGGLPVLMAVLGPFTFTYRRPLVAERDKSPTWRSAGGGGSWCWSGATRASATWRSFPAPGSRR